MASALDNVPPTLSAALIFGLLGASMMAFFLGCTNCRQSKPRGATVRRPPPQTPDLDSLQRYQSNPHLADPEPNGGYSVPSERLPRPAMKSQTHRIVQSSAEAQTQARGAEQLSDYANITDGDAAVIRKDHLYLEVFPSNTEMSPESSDQGKASTIRISVESTGETPSLSESLSHSYENISVPAKAMRQNLESSGKESCLSETLDNPYVNGSPVSATSVLDADYVNLGC